MECRDSIFNTENL